jgi:NADPH:quinone reductase-like Zn-dependent oxidoreductase
MKAIQAAERGGYEALRLVDIPQPQPQAGQALVRVTSAGVTPLDRTVLAGGQIAPAHDRSFPLEQAAEALRHLIEDRPFGKVTLTVDASPVR